jgi:hypothetical protein
VAELYRPFGSDVGLGSSATAATTKTVQEGLAAPFIHRASADELRVLVSGWRDLPVDGIGSHFLPQPRT